MSDDERRGGAAADGPREPGAARERAAFPDEPPDGPLPQGPLIASLSVGRGGAGTPLTIAGSRFAARTSASQVLFSWPGLGRSVAAPIDSWRASTITTRVPDLSALGSGGTVQVFVVNAVGGSNAVEFVLLEASPPSLVGVVPEIELAGRTVTLSGLRFGHDPTDPSPVLVAGAAATLVDWRPESIRARVPPAATVGGAGVKSIVVRTAWGQSKPVSFTVAAPPAIASITPAEGAWDTAVTISGSAFETTGDVRMRSRDRDPVTNQPLPTQVEAPMEVLSWAPTAITVVIASPDGFPGAGDKDVIVTTRWGDSNPARLTIRERGSITSWTRLEPHARTEDLELGLRRGLEARVYDALWLLGRQWQLGEFDGEDTGTPVQALVEGESAPLARWRAGRAGGSADLPGAARPTPLEALVEREPVPVAGEAEPDATADLRLAAEAGLAFLRHLGRRVTDARRVGELRAAFTRAYPLAPSERAELDAGSRRLLAVVAGRVPNGARLRAELRVALPPEDGGRGELPPSPPVAAAERDQVLAAVRDWFASIDRRFSRPSDGQGAWDHERMEYAFAVSAETRAGELVLAAPEHAGGALDWHSFELRPGESLRAQGGARPPAQPIARRLVPAPIGYPGMPAARWWELEDARVDFGAVEAGPADLLRLLFVEFATIYANDWYLIPVDGVPVGSLSTIDAVRVTDTFGHETVVGPLARDERERWRMFELSSEPDGDAGAGLLFLAPTLVATLESAPLEEVVLARDELANMAWGIERSVQGASGRPLARSEEEAARAGRGPVPAADAPLAYRLASAVPANWIPLVPRQDAPGRLERRALARPDGGPGGLVPRGRILEPERERFELFEEEVPREGRRVTRGWRYARWTDGGTHVWIGRRTGPGKGEASSGLRFDSLERRGEP